MKPATNNTIILAYLSPCRQDENNTLTIILVTISIDR